MNIQQLFAAAKKLVLPPTATPFGKTRYQLRVDNYVKAGIKEQKRIRAIRYARIEVIKARTAARNELRREIGKRHGVNWTRVVLMAALHEYNAAQLPMYVIKHRHTKNEVCRYVAG